MPGKFVRTNSNVGDLITSAGLLGNSLKRQESQSETQAGVTNPARRPQVSRSSSTEPPVLATLLARSGSGKKKASQPGWPFWRGSAPIQSSQDSPQSLTTPQSADSPSATAGHAASPSNGGRLHISAAKPDLLAQIQAIKLAELPSVPLADKSPKQRTEGKGSAFLITTGTR
ncbi:hypothetical protein ABBQ38_002617 [Trebouxia sp. C0009 RCD-2024]